STLLAAFACAPYDPAAADDYPSRPITMIVPYPPGGGVDLLGRLVGPRLPSVLGQQVVIENRGGAGGMIGKRDAARAAPDGYTIVMLLTGISLGSNTGYDVNKDFAPIGLVASTPIIVDAHPSLLAKSLADVIALAKKEPGKLSAGTPPAPTINYFAARLFNLLASTDIAVVTYKGFDRHQRRRPVARAGGRRDQTLGRRARGADRCGIRPAGFRGSAVLRPRRASRHAAPDCQLAQQ